MSIYLQCKQICTTVTLRAWQAVYPHRPLIQFRYGPTAAASDRASSATVPPVMVAPPVVAASAPSGGRSKWAAVQRSAVLEEWQVPARYRRLPLEDKEIEAINMGGSL